MCRQNKGHKSTCVYAIQEAPKSDKMCTREEIYEFLFKLFKNKKIPSDKDYCDMSKKWKEFPLNILDDAYVTSYYSYFENLDSDQLFPLHKIKYNVTTLSTNLAFQTTSPRPDTTHRTEQRIVKFNYNYHEEWDLILPVPTEEITLDIDVIYHYMLIGSILHLLIFGLKMAVSHIE